MKRREPSVAIEYVPSDDVDRADQYRLSKEEEEEEEAVQRDPQFCVWKMGPPLMAAVMYWPLEEIATH